MRMLLPLTQLLQARRCRTLSILVQNSEGNAVPAGMLLTDMQTVEETLQLLKRQMELEAMIS